MASGLTPKQAQFVREYLIDLNATQAAVRSGYSPATAKEQGSRLLTNVNVSEAVAAAMEKRAAKTEITAEAVLRELWAIGTANHNELIQFRRTCCRYCWGESFLYQRTVSEIERARAAYDNALELDGAHASPTPPETILPFDEKGGPGYDARRPPNADCPECFGEGIGSAFVADTRDLSPEAAKLYAGVKITKDGMEVKMHDKVGALTQVGRHLGMFNDKLEHTGAIGITITSDDADL